MKQTNNAIKFLMAQYRAIFKNAYFKGMATAMVLTAGLAAGQASATATTVSGDNWDEIFKDGSSVTIDNSTYKLNITVNDNKDVILPATGGTANITSGGSSENLLKTTSGGQITLKDKNFTLNINTSKQADGLFIEANTKQTGTSGDITIDIGELNVTSGVLQAKTTENSSKAYGDITITAKNIVVGGSTEETNPGKIILNTVSNDANIQLGNNVSENYDKASLTTLKDGGVIQFEGTTKSMFRGYLDAQGGLLDFTSGSGTIKAVSWHESLDGTLVHNNEIITDSNKPNTQVNIKVGAGKQAVIALDSLVDKTGDTSTVYRGVLNFGSGSVVELQQKDSTSGGFLDITSGTASEGSVVKFEKGSLITVSGTNSTNTNSGAYIGIKGVGAAGAKLTDVYFDSGVLDSFLTADKVLENNTLDSAGSIFLQGNANLRISDGRTLNINEKDAIIGIDKDGELNLKVNSGSAAPAIKDVANGGLIYFTGKDNTIYADTIKISGKLDQPAATENEITFSAKDLVLGSASHDSSQKLGFTEAFASNSITFVPKEGETEFTLQDKVLANAEYFAPQKNNCDPLLKNDSQKLTINNDFIVSGSKSHEGNLRVIGGDWTSDSNITLKQGTVTVYTDSNTSHIYGNQAKLTLTGKVIFSGGATSQTFLKAIGSNNASSILDLRETTLVTEKGSGSILVSGNAVNANDKLLQYYAESKDEGLYNDKVGYGIALINNNQLSQIVNGQNADDTSSKVGIFITSGGVVQVSNFNNSSFDMASFTHSEKASQSDGKVVFKDGEANTFLDLGDGTLNLVGKDNNAKLNISSGTIVADAFTFKTYKTGGSGDLHTSSTIEAGNLEVGSRISTDNSQLILGSNSSAATLNLDAGFSGSGTISIAKATDKDGKVTTDGVLNIAKSGAVTVETGTWTAQDVDISGAGTLSVESNRDSNGYLVGASFTADNYAQATTGKLNVAEKASATFNSMQLANTTDGLTVQGHLTINGVTISEEASKGADPAAKSYKTAGIDFNDAKVTVSGAGAVLEFGKVATSGLLTLTGTGDNVDTEKLVINKDGIDKATFEVNTFGQVKFNFADGTTLDKYDVGVLVNRILPNSTTGYLNLANANLNITKTARSDGYFDAKWSDVEPFAKVVGHATTDELLKTVVTVDKNSTLGVRGHFAAFVQGETGALTIDGPTSLHHADANGGNFVSNNGQAADVSLQLNGALALANGGKIGSINSIIAQEDDIIDYDGVVVEDGLNSVYIYNETEGAKSLTEVLGSIKGVNELGISADTQVRDDVNAKDVFVDTASLLEVGKTLTAQGIEVETGSQVKALNTTITNNGVVMGKSTTTETLHVSEDNNNAANLLVYGGEVYTKDLILGVALGSNTGSIEVGTGVNAKEDNKDTIYDETKAYNGILEVTGTATLNHGELSVVAEKDAGVSFASLNNLTNYSETTAHKAGVLDGGLYVGQHGVAGVGVENLATLKSELSNFYNGAALTQEDAQSILYLGKSFTIGGDKGDQGDAVILTSQTYEDFVKYIAKSNTDNKLTNPHIDAPNCGDLSAKHVLYMGDNTTIVVSEEVARNADKRVFGDKATAMISFAGVQDFNSGKGVVIADGGHMYINGNVRASTYQVFDNATIEYLDQKPYRPLKDGVVEANEEKDIYVSTENNFLNGYVEQDGTVSLQIDKNGRAIMAGASDPLYATLVAYVRGYNGDEPKAEDTKPDTPNKPEGDTNTPAQKATTSTPAETIKPQEPSIYPGVSKDRWLYSYDKNGKVVYGQYHNEFLQQTIATGNGSAAENVNRLGVYGGAAQVALVAGNTTTDAIAGRMGMGLNAAQLSQADNGQGAGLWVSPVYRNSESDSFGSQGVNYGVDVDVYGVALGGDITVSNGLRVGAMFNVGSGDSTGKGAATNVKNDFNYYGFGAYVGYTMDKFSVVGDISYTRADNDIDANTSIEKVGSSLDSTNLSLGVTGQYNLTLANDVLVSPHAGLRFSRIDLDNYTVRGAEDVAYFDAKALNVFSVPVGVTFSKVYEGESWTVQPSVDLTLTGNFGDDSLDGETYWAGVENLVTKTSTEVLDNFTYGVTAGFTAKTGSFSMGLGVNYTGSSNTSEFGVNANARFTF